MDKRVEPGAIYAELRAIYPKLQARYPLRQMALFGSMARGDATARSDVDVLVEVDPSIGLRMVDLADELEAHLQRKVDLISSRAVQPHMMEAIESDLRYV